MKRFLLGVNFIETFTAHQLPFLGTYVLLQSVLELLDGLAILRIGHDDVFISARLLKHDHFFTCFGLRDVILTQRKQRFGVIAAHYSNLISCSRPSIISQTALDQEGIASFVCCRVRSCEIEISS